MPLHVKFGALQPETATHEPLWQLSDPLLQHVLPPQHVCWELQAPLPQQWPASAHAPPPQLVSGGGQAPTLPTIYLLLPTSGNAPVSREVPSPVEYVSVNICE